MSSPVLVKDDEEIPPPKPTMAQMWEELNHDELQGLANMAGVNMGQMALTKISTILKAIHYKHNPMYQNIGGLGQYNQGIANQYQGIQTVPYYGTLGGSTVTGISTSTTDSTSPFTSGGSWTSKLFGT